MTKPKTHQILIIFGLLSLGIAAFLPLGYTIIYPHQFNDIEDYIVLPKFGIASGAYYLNFILLAIPFLLYVVITVREYLLKFSQSYLELLHLFQQVYFAH